MVNLKKYIKFFSFFVIAFLLFNDNVFAETSSARIYYDENNVTSNSKLVDTNHYFANMGSGTLKSNLTIYISDKDYQLSGIQNTSLPLVRQIIASNGSEEFVCDIGTSSISYTLATDQSAQNTSQLYYLVVNYSYSCDMEMTDYGLADITVYYLPQSSGQPINTVSFGPVFSFTQSDNSVIVNSQQQTTNAVNDVNQSITSSDVEEGTGNTFFNDFSTTDNGGISGIITAPLTAINSMLDGTCSPLTATVYGKEVSLPCGTEFWNNAGPIKTFLSWFEGGFLCYVIIKAIFELIHDLKDPDNDKVEVMSL